MELFIILILAFILIGFIALNYYKSKNTTTSTSAAASCAQTTFGCCPNGVDSKINFYGTNCPGYVPGPGYLPTPVIIQPVLPPPPQPVPPPPHPIYKPHPVGGCAGTRYGCCPDNITAKIDEVGSNCLIKPVGGCAGTRYGCCPDNITAKFDEVGSNCVK
jgi:hypothetical protein